MKKKTIYIIIGVILALGLIIYLLTKIPKKEFDSFTFPETIEVVNHTESKMVDTMTMVILNKVMGYDEMKIDIYDMPDIFKPSSDDENELIAFIAEVPFEDHRYKIFLKEDVRLATLFGVFSHEMVHLKQHEDGRLQVIEGRGYVWEGDSALYTEVEYGDRPYEKEAIVESPIIRRKLINILYKD